MDVVYGQTKDFVFKDAIAFLKAKKALTTEEYRSLDNESQIGRASCRERVFGLV